LTFVAGLVADLHQVHAARFTAVVTRPDRKLCPPKVAGSKPSLAAAALTTLASLRAALAHHIPAGSKNSRSSIESLMPDRVAKQAQFRKLAVAGLELLVVRFGMYSG
jgi:hypothetical protein